MRAALAPLRGTAAAQRLYEDPATQLPHLVDEVRRYWRVALRPISARLHALGAADISFRAEQFAIGGVAQVLDTLHPSVCFTGDRLVVDDARPGRRAWNAGGAGVLLVPGFFCWPRPSAHPPTAGGLMLTYPVRGMALLEEPTTAPHAAPLRHLVGPTRATLLAALALPATTTELANQVRLSAATVSQHLKVLKATGLATARRHGRRVLYQRTEAANALLAAPHPAGAGDLS